MTLLPPTSVDSSSSYTILWWGIRIGGLMYNSMIREICHKVIVHIFLPIISADNLNLGIKLICNQLMKILETSKNFMLTPKHVNPCHTGIAVDKGDKTT